MADPVGLAALYESNPQVRRHVDDKGMSAGLAAHNILANGYTTSERAVRRLRAKQALHTGTVTTPKTVSPSPKDAPEPGSGKMSITGSEGTFENVAVDAPIVNGNWDHVFERFHLDPAEFVIVDDTVRMSTWQQSKRLENGDRDTINLYSYSARFQRKVSADSVLPTLDDYRGFIEGNRPYRSKAVAPAETPASTFVFCAADFQLGKSAGGGVAETLRKFDRALERAVLRVQMLQDSGRNVERVLIAQMGDIIEAVQGHYAAQTFTVELNLRDQITLAVDVLLKCVDAFAPHVPRLTLLSVISNHGEISRSPNSGNKAITDSGDSADVLVARMVERVVRATPGLEHVDFVTPDDEIIIMETVSGVPVAFTHGHTGPSSSDNIKAENEWMAKQSLNLLRRYASEPKLWITAHRHHFMALDLGPYFRLQCPSLDGGSAWYENSSGKWSTAGVLTFLVGTEDERKFSDLQIL